MSVVIRSIAAHVPEQRVSNDDLALRLDTSDEWIRSHTGIGARHFAPDGVLTSDMAASAALAALEKARISPKNLDLIVVASATPDYFGFPATACVVQDKIGAHGCAAFDVTAGCTGFIYALNIAASMLEAGKGRNALVIGAETLSRITDWNDRASCVLFGDGAGAAVLSRIDEPGRGCLSFILGADGSGVKDLYLVQTPRIAT
ncbi:MAG: 3-oxoacyl-ACP synthase, partial [Rectinema sp.]